MIQKSYACTSRKETAAAIRAEGERARGMRYESAMALLFYSGVSMEAVEGICGQLDEEIPGIRCAGISLFEGPGDPKGGFLRMSFFFFQSSRVDILRLPCRGAEVEEAAEALRESLSLTRDLAGVLLFPAGIHLHVSRFVELSSEGYEDIPFFGALANAGTMDGNIDQNIGFSREQGLYALGGTPLEEGVVAVLLSGSELRIETDYILGWKPIGKPMEVELGESAFFGETALKKVDGIPAAKIYRRYLGVVPDRHFASNICEFPIVLTRDDCLLSRVPAAADDQNALCLMGDVRPGEKIRLSYGKRHDIFAGTARGSERMRRFAPEGLLLILCGNRSIFLRGDAHIEIDLYRRYHEELVYCHGLSEIWRHRGKGGVLNSALVAVGFREGEAGAVQDASEDSCGLKELCGPPEGPIPLEERLVSFMEAMTEELVIAYADVAMMAKGAEAASRAKSAFLSNMSHEIRTPINAVLGMDEMILRESGEEEIRNYAWNIKTAGATLLSLVNDILDFSKIEAGKMEIIEVDYDLSSVINDLVNMIRPRAEGKRLQLIVRVDPSLPHLLHGDEIRIKQVLTNILTNGVKYTEKGSVTLSVSLDSQDAEEKTGILRFAVQDTGIGIKPEDMDRLYSAFDRIEEERNRTIEGTGLGMSITRELLELMGSELEVESVYGSGSTFSFRLKQGIVRQEPIGDYEETFRRSVSTQTYHESFTAPEARILVVDDTPMNLKVFTGLLKKTRVQIDTAESGDEALALAAARKYDAIFLDHRMPGKDGVETLAELRGQSANPNNGPHPTPVISLTANAVSGAREEYMAAGFDDYLTKPIEPDRLEAMLIRFLPADKVEPSPEEADGERPPEEAEEMGHDGDDAPPLPDWLSSVPGLDASRGVANCGGAGNYLTALSDYAAAGEDTARELERCLGDNDLKGYTIRVHALKSTSRIVGLAELGDLAEALEAAGNAGDRALLLEKTPPLLGKLREALERLEPLAAPEAAEEGLPLMSAEELRDALGAIRELAARFDYEGVLSVMEMLKGYRCPADAAERMRKLKKAVGKPDWDEIAALSAEG